MLKVSAVWLWQFIAGTSAQLSIPCLRYCRKVDKLS